MNPPRQSFPDDVDEDDYDDEPLELAARRWADLRRRAMARVKAPGTILQVCGVLVTVLGLGSLLLLACIYLWAPRNTGGPQAVGPGIAILWVFVVVGVPITLVAGPIIFIGGRKMRQLESYKWAMTATVLLLTSGLLISIWLAALAIWPLVVLLNFDVQMAFQKSGLPEEYEPLTRGK